MRFVSVWDVINALNIAQFSLHHWLGLTAFKVTLQNHLHGRSMEEYPLLVHISGLRRYRRFRNIHWNIPHFFCCDSNLIPHKLQATELSVLWIDYHVKVKFTYAIYHAVVGRYYYVKSVNSIWNDVPLLIIICYHLWEYIITIIIIHFSGVIVVFNSLFIIHIHWSNYIIQLLYEKKIL